MHADQGGAVADVTPATRDNEAARLAATVYRHCLKTDEANRLLLTAAARSGYSGDRNRHIRVEALKRSTGHLSGYLWRHGTVFIQVPAVHAEQVRLRFIRIGDNAPRKVARSSG